MSRPYQLAAEPLTWGCLRADKATDLYLQWQGRSADLQTRNEQRNAVIWDGLLPASRCEVCQQVCGYPRGRTATRPESHS